MSFQTNFIHIIIMVFFTKKLQLLFKSISIYLELDT